jgi:hypothetical protein
MHTQLIIGLVLLGAALAAEKKPPVPPVYPTDAARAAYWRAQAEFVLAQTNAARAVQALCPEPGTQAVIQPGGEPMCVPKPIDPAEKKK